MDAVELIKNKNQKGLSTLYDNYANALMGIAMSVLHHNETAEEILQETFLKVWNNIESFDPTKGTLFTWMATIVRRSAIDKKRLKSFGATTTIEAAKEAAVNTNDHSLDTQKILEFLDTDQREVLDMIYLQGYTQQQTAEALTIPLGTVKSRVRLALKALRAKLDTEKSLFLGMTILIIITLLTLWV